MNNIPTVVKSKRITIQLELFTKTQSEQQIITTEKNDEADHHHQSPAHTKTKLLAFLKLLRTSFFLAITV